MKTRKQERKKTVLVWVTNPDACQSIVSAGRKLADDNKVELVIVSIQGSIKGDWNNRASDLKKLSEAAKSADAELTVVYSDDMYEAAHDTIKRFKPMIMVTGLPGNLGAGSFLEQIMNMAPGVPIYSVDMKENMKRLDTISLRIS
ncbi:MAG TPA: hypothetical protein PLI11_09240 [Clostridia bacterium]|jgi:K+-sensing histidine kinase KdpD|nr:hypothetical protein [Clostridiaceae bacterium]HPZ53091.1 hypothetical protein [Clostridia bacterium]